MVQRSNPLHVRKPRGAFEELLRYTAISLEWEAQIPDTAGGTFLWHREHLEPLIHTLRSEVDGIEEVPSAPLSPRVGHKRARL